LRSGVTTVRDLGDHHWAVQDRFRRPDEPVVVASGPPITTPGGHCAAMGGEADGDAGLVHAVAERAERRADLVKIIVSGGAMTAGSDLCSAECSEPGHRVRDHPVPADRLLVWPGTNSRRLLQAINVGKAS
jgi:hypothetical protein